MAYRRTEFAIGEWYHCYTRSIDRKSTFKTQRDYERFLQALYLCNGIKSNRRGTLYRPSHNQLLALDRGKPLVAIGAFCIMPNHFHLLLHEIVEGGISSFMQKVGTSYSMYFNVKYAHVGNVFIKPFRSKHIHNDHYLKYVVQYIHLNPAELFEHKWKSGSVGNMKKLEEKLIAYRFSSLQDYQGTKRREGGILDTKAMSMFEDRPSFKNILIEAKEYYQGLNLNL